MTLTLSLDLPVYAAGDEKRLLQIILTVVGNAVKFTKEGYVSIDVSVAKPEYIRDWQSSEFHPLSTDGHFYLQVQVKYINTLWSLYFPLRACLVLSCT